MSAATVQQLSGGRLIPGLGTSTPVIVQQWMGVPFEHPLTRVRETVAAIRSAFNRDKVTVKGKTVQINGFRMNVTLDKPPPIYLGAQGEKMLRLVGAIGDGLITNFITPESLPPMIEHVPRVTGRRQGLSAPLEVLYRIFVGVDEDSDALRNDLRRHLTAYMTVPQYNNFFREIGFEHEAATAAEAWNAGDRKAALAAVPDRMLEEIYVFGSLDRAARGWPNLPRPALPRRRCSRNRRARSQGAPRPDSSRDRGSRQRLARIGIRFRSFRAAGDALSKQVGDAGRSFTGRPAWQYERSRSNRRPEVSSPTSRRYASARVGTCSLGPSPRAITPTARK